MTVKSAPKPANRWSRFPPGRPAHAGGRELSAP